MINVIVIEDDVAIQEVMSLVFVLPEYELNIYDNGDPIVKGDYTKPDIFLIDKLLSGIDGLDICKLLKTQEQTRHIPVIILSASPNVANLAKLAGADGFVEKPFMLQFLRDEVAKALDHRGIK